MSPSIQSRAYDPSAFKVWASKEACQGIPPVLGLFMALLDKGFKVFLLSGRDEETLGPCTAGNLEAEGFSGCERLIMRYEHDAATVSFGTRSAVLTWTAEHSDSPPNRKRLDGAPFAVKNVIRIIYGKIAPTICSS